MDLFLPARVGKLQHIQLDIDYALSMGALLKSNTLTIFEYDGSGTTVNNCPSTSTWFVYKPIFYIDPATVTLFTNYMKLVSLKADFSAAGTNNRNPQALGGRSIK